ncbi:MAG: hypothetical protein LQ338_006364 [Usnochroma carphineum]|nr:MAG: hypothetical protein LQ338_006364 [Usnochroma carphineum]
MSPTAEQWNERKEEILRLYIDEGWTLKPVMRKMQTADFHPTESQYRTKLKKWKRRKPRNNHPHHPKAGSPVPSATAPDPSPSTSARDQLPSQPCGTALDLNHSLAPEEIIPVDPSSQVQYQWQPELENAGSGFQPALTDQQPSTQIPLLMVDNGGQPPSNVHVDQYYGEEFFDPDEYRNLARKRAAESAYGNAGYTRVERDKRWRSQPSSQQLKNAPPCPTIPTPNLHLSPHLAEAPPLHMPYNYCATGMDVMEGQSSWWLGEGNDPYRIAPSIQIERGLDGESLS